MKIGILLQKIFQPILGSKRWCAKFWNAHFYNYRAIFAIVNLNTQKRRCNLHISCSLLYIHDFFENEHVVLWKFLGWLKVVFSKKATKIDEIFTVDLTLTIHNVKSMVKISSIFVAFLENMNFRQKNMTLQIWEGKWNFRRNVQKETRVNLQITIQTM